MCNMFCSKVTNGSDGPLSVPGSNVIIVDDILCTFTKNLCTSHFMIIRNHFIYTKT